jgi:glycosyltransferase involved in cell wall biosynthesis
VLQISYGSILGHKPLSYLSVLLILFGSQSLSLGLLSEMLTSVSLKKGRPRISIRRRLIHKKGGTPPELSVVIPIHNERESLVELYERLMPVLAELALSYEIVFVDDGSTDGSTTILEGFFEGESRVTLVELRRRSGKASALQVGFNHAQGDIICTLDGDLQDRPEDVGMLVQKVKGGADFAVGRRRGVSKLQAILSGAFNRLVATLTSVEIHDFNCGLRAFRKRVIQNVVLRGELHRFFPVLVAAKGFRVQEVDVAHLRRMAGRSKYDLSRIPKAFLDLFAVVLLAGYVRRPLHLFGSVGITISALGLAITGYLTALKLSTGNIGDHYTLLLFGVMFVVLGLQWFGTGVIGELLNNYFADDAD